MLSVIIPTYQESVKAREIGQIFTDMGYDVQVVISTDQDPHIGKGNAVREGLLASTSEHILIMDADMQIPPQEIKTFFKIMELYDADAVIGNKRHPYSNIEYTFFRKIISWGYRFLIAILFSPSLRDTQCGFKLFKRDVLMLIIEKIKSNRYAFDLELIIALKENGFRVVDAPVYVKRQVNKGSVRFLSIWQTLWDTLLIWKRKQEGWYKV